MPNLKTEVALFVKQTMSMVLVCLLMMMVVLASGHTDGFTLGIRDSIMIAHSFSGEEFGPAQNMHGATYTVDVDFDSPELAEDSNWVIDIGEASALLSEVLKKYNFKVLNELFPDENTTTEFMCKTIHGDLAECLRKRKGGAWRGRMRVKLHESHKAWAAYAKDV